MARPLTLALPKGRILKEALPLLARAGIVPEPDFSDEGSRKLMFATSQPDVRIIRVRSFDAATFVAFGAADIGIAGNDVLLEFDFSEIYAPVDLGIGHCRLSVAQPATLDRDMSGISAVRVATKYPGLTRRHFAARGIQAECVKLNGAMELAPLTGLAPRIVDLVSTGRTLAENGLVEIEVIARITSRLIVNRAAWKTHAAVVPLVERLRALVETDRAAAA
ncbi:ATP phosphoribosyltransferase [Polymorphobacter sp.]|uniref:ATP phosphoribosyltransferase n=1 Tax=Polymorphobacter sp. TaxID=1909290 RepID=UPI003F70694F